MFNSYTYYLYHIPTGKKYYGVRMKPKANPVDDLWNIYFGSSDLVDALIVEYGKDSFRAEVRKIFDDPYTAYIWEQTVLKKLNAIHKPEWLNQGLAEKWYRVGPMTEEHKNNIRKSKIGKRRGPRTLEWSRKIIESNIGKLRSTDSKNRMSEAQKRRFMTHPAPMQGKHHTKETIEKIRISNIGKNIGKPSPMRGRKHSEEAKQKNREKHLGKSAWNKGISPSDETRSRMSQSRKGKKRGSYKKGA
jgi:hypothetical protein